MIKLIDKHARQHQKKVTYREGGNHTICTVGKTTFPIGRHAELKRGEVRSIVGKLAQEFGKDWRRK